MHFFTADEHFAHTNILKYCDRPFKDTEEMDNEIIRRHNELVKTCDTVWHLGDFTLREEKEALNYIRRLNGSHVFIKGSHDYWADNVFNVPLPYIIEEMINGIYVVGCHYAMRTWPRSYHGSILAYGHSHGNLPPDKNQWDVGVDNNDFYPVSLDKLLKLTKYEPRKNDRKS